MWFIYSQTSRKYKCKSQQKNHTRTHTKIKQDSGCQRSNTFIMKYDTLFLFSCLLWLILSLLIRSRTACHSEWMIILNRSHEKPCQWIIRFVHLSASAHEQAVWSTSYTSVKAPLMQWLENFMHILLTYSLHKTKHYRLHKGGVFAGLSCLKSYTDHTNEAKFIPSCSIVSLLIAPVCCSDGRSGKRGSPSVY